MKTYLLLLALLSLSLPGSAGNVVGNGGDHVRATFIAMGQAVLAYLQQSPKGQELVAAKQLDMEKLAAALTIDKISVVENTLVDNGGSVVDALGEPGRVVLNKFSWFDHFEKGRDVYYLVLHEMLRENGVNDDNYVVSGAISPFAESFRIGTRIGHYEPLLQEDLLDGILDAAGIFYNGSGCPAGSISVNFDKEQNTAELVFPAYAAKPQEGRSFDRRHCALGIPVKATEGKQLVISLVDMESHVNIPQGSSAVISTESFLAGSSSPRTERAITAPSAAGVQGRALFRRTEVLRANCGKDSTLRLNSSLVTYGQAAAKITGVKLFFSLESCR